MKTIPFAAIGCSLYILLLPVPAEYDIALLVFAIFAALSVLFSEQVHGRYHSHIDLTVFSFVAAWGLATFFSQNAQTSLLLSAPLLPAVLTYFLVAHNSVEYSDLFVICLALMTSLLVFSTGLLIFYVDKPHLPTEQLVDLIGSNLFVVPNDTIFLALLSPFALAVFHGSPRVALKLCAALSILMGIAAALVYQSRGATLTFIVAIAIYTWLLRPRAWLRLVAMLSVVVVFLDICFGLPLFNKFARFSDGRFSLWYAALMMFIDKPLSGFGPHTFGFYYEDFLAGVSFPRWAEPDWRRTPWPHNLYLELLSEYGVIGFTSFMVMLASALGWSWKIQQDVQAGLRPYAAATFTMLAAFAVASLYELSFMRIWVNVMFFMVVGMTAFMTSIYSRQENCSGTTTAPVNAKYR